MPKHIFKPMKAPSKDLLRLFSDESDKFNPDNFPFQNYGASVKYDGIRAEISNGDILSARGKALGNKHFHEVFTPIFEWSKANPTIHVEGELYHPDLTFQEITSIVRSHDGELDKLEFHVFDFQDINIPDRIFKERYSLLRSHVEANEWGEGIVAVEQEVLHNYDEFYQLFTDITEDGGEGLMLKAWDSHYKYGRATVNQGTFFKVKKFLTADVTITGFIEGEKLKDGAEVRKGYWDGRTERSRKKADYQKSGTLGALIVQFGEHEVRVGSGLNDSLREKIWRNQPEFIGRTIEMRYMDCGRKNLPRFPTFIRFREDKD
jgi:DNA ligase-1